MQVPRLLFDDVQMLESYVIKSNDQAIRRWWAQYMESTGGVVGPVHGVYRWSVRSGPSTWSLQVGCEEVGVSPVHVVYRWSVRSGPSTECTWSLLVGCEEVVVGSVYSLMYSTVYTNLH